MSKCSWFQLLSCVFFILCANKWFWTVGQIKQDTRRDQCQCLAQAHFGGQLEPGFDPPTLWSLDDPVDQLSHSCQLCAILKKRCRQNVHIVGKRKRKRFACVIHGVWLRTRRVTAVDASSMKHHVRLQHGRPWQQRQPLPAGLYSKFNLMNQEIQIVLFVIIYKTVRNSLTKSLLFMNYNVSTEGQLVNREGSKGTNVF